MNDAAAYILITAVLTVPLIAMFPRVLEMLFLIVKMSTALIGTPWP